MPEYPDPAIYPPNIIFVGGFYEFVTGHQRSPFAIRLLRRASEKATPVIKPIAHANNNATNSATGALSIRHRGAAERAKLHRGNDKAPAATAAIDIPGLAILVGLELSGGAHFGWI